MGFLFIDILLEQLRDSDDTEEQTFTSRAELQWNISSAVLLVYFATSLKHKPSDDGCFVVKTCGKVR